MPIQLPVCFHNLTTSPPHRPRPPPHPTNSAPPPGRPPAAPPSEVDAPAASSSLLERLRLPNPTPPAASQRPVRHESGAASVPSAPRGAAGGTGLASPT